MSFDARILQFGEALRAEGRISRTEPYTHNVPFSHRSGERIEPLISLQWFMRMDELAAPALEVVRDGRVRIRPEGQRRHVVPVQDDLRVRHGSAVLLSGLTGPV